MTRTGFKSPVGFGRATGWVKRVFSLCIHTSPPPHAHAHTDKHNLLQLNQISTNSEQPLFWIHHSEATSQTLQNDSAALYKQYIVLKRADGSYINSDPVNRKSQVLFAVGKKKPALLAQQNHIITSVLFVSV